MPNPFICLNNFNHHHHHHHQEEENNGLNQKRSNLCRRRAQGSSANRYSKRGLDKFTALLARLHEKRRRIYSEKMGCNLKNRNADMKKLNQEQKCRHESEMPQIKTGVSERSKNVNKWRRPGCYLPVIMILVLLFLVLLGRSTAIMSTCVGWYVLPTLKGEGSAVRCKNNIESTLQPWRRSSADKDEIM